MLNPNFDTHNILTYHSGLHVRMRYGKVLYSKVTYVADDASSWDTLY